MSVEPKRLAVDLQPMLQAIADGAPWRIIRHPDYDGFIYVTVEIPPGAPEYDPELAERCYAIAVLEDEVCDCEDCRDARGDEDDETPSRTLS